MSIKLLCIERQKLDLKLSVNVEEKAGEKSCVTFINLMFIHIYMNILIYNQERRECTMQKKIFIYKSINKQRQNQDRFFSMCLCLKGNKDCS